MKQIAKPRFAAFWFAALLAGFSPLVDSAPAREVPEGTYQVKQVQGGLNVFRHGRRVSRIRTARPNLEAWSFWNGDGHIVTKSRGNHGPATIEKFETATGRQVDKIPAFAVRNGKPAWAAQYAE